MSREPERRRLHRSAERRVGGVAGGMADYLGTDPTIARLAWVLVGLAHPPLAIAAYVVFWVALPESGASERREPADPLLVGALIVAVLVVFAGGRGPRLPWGSLLSPVPLPGGTPWALVLLLAGVGWVAWHARGGGRPDR